MHLPGLPFINGWTLDKTVFFRKTNFHVCDVIPAKVPVATHLVGTLGKRLFVERICVKLGIDMILLGVIQI